MSLLPTAHAGQSYGSRRIDFYTVSGEVTAAEGHSGRIVDNDGIVHAIRLTEKTEALRAGDSATVLRVQAGPNRKSQPAAVVNHTRGSWIRTAPDATTVLARCGIVRSLNWWLAVLVLALTVLAAVWTDLHAFLTEVGLPGMGELSALDVRGDLAALMPSLPGWQLQGVLPGGVLDAIAALGVVPMDRLTEIGIAAAATALAMAAFFARSWRLIYVPLLAGFAIIAGVIFSATAVTLAILGGALAFFAIAGVVNRIRDSGRFGARVERLAEHILRNPPEEGVRASDRARSDGRTVPAAATVIASAAAMADGENASDRNAQAGAETLAADGEEFAAAPSEDASNGEVEAPQAVELPPAPPAPDAVPQAKSGDTKEDAAPARANGSGNETSMLESEAVQGVEEDDDLPSLDAVAAAAALSAAETASQADAEAPAADLDDERTMPVAAPPPMPASTKAAEQDAVTDADRAPEQSAREPEAMASEPETPSQAGAHDTAADIEPRSVHSPIDDPMFEGTDPMLPRSQAGDYAPGAPDLEFDREPAE